MDQTREQSGLAAAVPQREPVDDPRVGRLVDSRYLIEERIARGGMGTVYRALDTRLHRRVAVKVLHDSLAEDESFVRRFRQEAITAATVVHPNVVTVTDQGSDGGTAFLVMEHVEGRTLRSWLSERGRLSPHDALDVMEPVLQALVAAHSAGLVHRDVKPENVLLAADGRVKVADFGLARAAEATVGHTSTGLLLGTASYLAPEQFEQGTADARTDVYAAGVVLFELLTGRPPHTGESPAAVAYQHVHHDVPPPSSLVPGIPPVVDDVVLAATRRSRETRTPSALQMLAGVTQARRVLAMSGAGSETTALPVADQATTAIPRVEQTTAIPVPAPVPGSRPRRSRRRSLVGLLVVALLASAAGVGWWFGSGRYVQAPTVIGLDRSAATTAASARHLKVRFAGKGVYDERVPEGKVATQQPAPGRRVVRNGTLVLAVSLGPLRYAVPTLKGLTEQAARARITSGHLAVGRVEEVYDETAAAGRVLSSDPKAGARVKAGTPVDLRVSKGPAPVSVPDVVGRTRADAEQLLTSAGLQVAVTERFDDQVERGHVISQDPSGGETAGRRSTVQLVVSKGPERVEVPDVRGMTTDEAKAELESVGLRTRVVPIPGIDDVVVRQSPKAGSVVESGTTVTIYVF